MTADRRREAALALHRFGFGPAHDSIAAISADPRGATLADLERQGAGQVAAANLLPSAATARALFDFRAERQAQEKLAQRDKKARGRREWHGSDDVRCRRRLHTTPSEAGK